MTDLPLLLLPGLMCDRAVWSDAIAELPGRPRVIVPDYGDVDTLGDMAERTLSEAPAHFAVAGHSMGGRVALEIFRRAPERVAGLALLDTNYTPRAAGEAGAREERERLVLLEIARRSGTRAMAESWVRGMVHPSRLAEAGLVGAILDMFARKSADVFAAQIRALLARPDATALLGAVRCPALVLSGREDDWAPVARHEEMAALIAGSELVVVERCGHMAPMERPRDVAAALARWHARSGARRAAAA